MQDKKRGQQEADISAPPLHDWWNRYQQCCTCNAWKLLTDGELRVIPTAGTQEKNPFGFDYVLQWHCNKCWQWKQWKVKEAKKDKDADKDEDKDEANDEGKGPSKKKKHMTFQPWEDSTPKEVDG